MNFMDILINNLEKFGLTYIKNIMKMKKKALKMQITKKNSEISYLITLE